MVYLIALQTYLRFFNSREYPETLFPLSVKRLEIVPYIRLQNVAVQLHSHFRVPEDEVEVVVLCDSRTTVVAATLDEIGLLVVDSAEESLAVVDCFIVRTQGSLREHRDNVVPVFEGSAALEQHDVVRLAIDQRVRVDSRHHWEGV